MTAPRCSKVGCSRPGTWRLTLVAMQASDGDVVVNRTSLPIVVCSYHKRGPAKLLLKNPRSVAVINRELLTRGRIPLDWSLVRIEFSRIQ